MYDGMTGLYALHCPSLGEVRVRLSSFRMLDRLPGPSRPAVYAVEFACPCGGEHEGLVTHDELDWAPLGATDTSFFNVMTRRLESAAAELLDRAVRLIRAGTWPWSFFCYPESRALPTFPSAFRLLAPADGGLGLAVRCPSCERTSVNLVSREHVDVPFYHDPHVAVIEHIFASDRATTIEAFREELDSSSFDARLRALGG